MADDTRKANADALQDKLGEVAGRYAYAARQHGSPAVRAQAKLMGSYISTVAGKAADSYKAGGAPAIDNHMQVIASAESHLAKMNVPPADEIDLTSTDPDNSGGGTIAPDASPAGWNG